MFKRERIVTKTMFQNLIKQAREVVFEKFTLTAAS